MKKTVSLTNKTAADIAQLAASFGISISECVERLLNRLQLVCQEDRSQFDELTKHLAGGAAQLDALTKQVAVADENRENYPQKREENVEFERDIVFTDRRGYVRCFYMRAVLPLFVHEEELFVQAVGEPEFKMVLKDCNQPVSGYDWDNFVAAVKTAAAREYKKYAFGKKRKMTA